MLAAIELHGPVMTVNCEILAGRLRKFCLPALGVAFLLLWRKKDGSASLKRKNKKKYGKTPACP